MKNSPRPDEEITETNYNIKKMSTTNNNELIKRKISIASSKVFDNNNTEKVSNIKLEHSNEVQLNNKVSQVAKKKEKENKADKEEQVNEWMNLLKTDCDNYPFCAILVNKDSIIKYCNDKTEQMFKYDREQLMNGGDINTLVPPAYRNKHQDQIKAQFKHNSTDQLENERVGQTKQDKEINVSYGLLLKKLEHGDDDISIVMCQVREVERDVDWLLILPENPVYILWISFMVLFISWTMVLLPYEFVFNRDEENTILNYSIQGLTLIDILFNFNCAQIEKDDVVTDRTLIFRNYFGGQFLIDLQTGIPVEIFDGLINPDILFLFKLLRSLKLIKYYQALNNEYIVQLLSKNEMFKNFKSLTMTQYFFQEMFLLICGIFVINHQIVSMWVMVCFYFQKDSPNWVNDSGLINEHRQSLIQENGVKFIFDYTVQDYIKWNPEIHFTTDPWEYKKLKPFDVYITCQLEIFSEFLGYNSLETQNNFEYNFSFVIKYSGLFLLAQTIGRISMLLTQQYKDGYVQSRMYQVIQSVASESTLSDNVIDTLLKEVSKNQGLMGDTLSSLRHSIPTLVQNKAQNEQYGAFLNQHKLFKQLPINSIETLQRNCKLKEGYSVLFEANQQATNFFLVIKGKVNAIDANNLTMEDYEENEIVGFHEAQTYVKRNLHLEDSHYSVHKGVTDIPSSREWLEKLKTDRQKHQQTAIAENGTQYQTASFAQLENLVKEDPEVWTSLQKQVLWDSVQVGKMDLQNTMAELDAQETKDESSIIFLPNGSIYSVNREFKKIFQKDETGFEGHTFFSLFEPMNKTAVVNREMTKLTSGKQTFNIFGKKIEVELNFNIKTLVIDKKRIADGKPTLISTKSETIFVQLSITNSIEAFLISKQRAVKHVGDIVNVEINLESRPEVEEEVDNVNIQQQEMMMRELRECNVEYKEFRFILDQRIKAKRMNATGSAFPRDNITTPSSSGGKGFKIGRNTMSNFKRKSLIESEKKNNEKVGTPTSPQKK